MSRIVIALGGNALGKTPGEQLELIRRTAVPIADLAAGEDGVVVTHGNGPQVGMISLGLGAAAASDAISGDMPLPECGAMSQGYIGYHLQNALQCEFASRGLRRQAVTLVTQTVVAENDPAFQHPTKPVGAFYTREQAERLTAERGWTMAEDAGRGYRQVVPSPRPIDVVEKDAVRDLLTRGYVVVAAGGGGIPVARRGDRLVGVPAVIDKDLASARLAELIGAQWLVILTAVDHVYLNYGKPGQTALTELSAAQAERFCGEGQFASGSMLPKVRAAVQFARTGGRTVIASLDDAAGAVRGMAGTVIHL